MHKSVLLNEVINGLNVKDNQIIVDMTVGNAGHLVGIVKTNANNLTLIGVDADQTAIENSKINLSKICAEKKSNHKIILEQSYFDLIDDVLEKNQIQKVDAYIFDLGFRSDQVDDPERGFSFLKDGPLDMSFSINKDKKDFFLSADLIVNTWSEETLADIIYGFGEEQFSRRIAKAIVEYRKNKKIETTTELSEIITKSVPFFYRKLKIHPATKTFQAIRIAVNSELDRLKKALEISFESLSVDGKIAVISFHSLEDRIVKIFFREMVLQKRAQYINKKPITATKEELLENPRSRSAKLRIIKKIN
ncbi:MAG TPA: 16S rRNA (cytosine(1402)-N(4))-methyltransferase RsmH [Candidatus Paceibacterota bacterium]|nr:16S rRNA (cytosine(1402)-N(4))-methyltransferase RsmH [Candidatus Paceibacterota bacterium]HMP18857.1 16S rRNA (cytosine(1402)-N(4))-methyltransferase RsmH [Candidatus Paceibacterota bacterium]HMP85179.1 16S rRNA (cytosine(1402)-N(4))-methyltransferase RsmH [Candidatus Paceibacterota bacterium]